MKSTYMCTQFTYAYLYVENGTSKMLHEYECGGKLLSCHSSSCKIQVLLYFQMENVIYVCYNMEILHCTRLTHCLLLFYA